MELKYVWYTAVLWLFAGSGCTSQKRDVSPTAANVVNEAELPGQAPAAQSPMVKEQIVGTFRGFAASDPSSPVTATFTPDGRTVLEFSGSEDQKPERFSGTWRIREALLYVTAQNSQKKATPLEFVFALNEEGSVLAGNEQAPGKQGPMMSLKKE